MSTPESSYRKKGPKPGSPRSYIMTDEIRAKMRESSARRWLDNSQKEHLSKKMSKVLPMDELASLYKVGWTMERLAWRYGCNKQTICKYMKIHNIEARIAGIPGHHFGRNHHNWKGNKASYNAIHTRVNRLKGKPKSCEMCGSTEPSQRYEWANWSGDYDNPEDYRRMCRPCHRNYDKERRKHEYQCYRSGSQSPTFDGTNRAFVWIDGKPVRNNPRPPKQSRNARNLGEIFPIQGELELKS